MDRVNKSSNITMQNAVSASLIKVLKEYGVVGVVTYIGGIILLIGFITEQNIQRQILLGVVGMILLSLSIFIAYFRLKIQKDREKALIEMAQNTGNRLAEQLGKNLSKEQVVSITQTIWQNQKDLITAIVDKIDEKEDS